MSSNLWVSNQYRVCESGLFLKYHVTNLDGWRNSELTGPLGCFMEPGKAFALVSDSSMGMQVAVTIINIILKSTDMLGVLSAVLPLPGNTFKLKRKTLCN